MRHDVYPTSQFRSDSAIAILLGLKSGRTKTSPNFSTFRPEFCPEFCSEFSPNFSRTFRASFRGRRRPEKIHQKSPPFFNAKFPGKHCVCNPHIQESPHPRAPKSPKSLKKDFPGLPARSVKKVSKKSPNTDFVVFLTLFWVIWDFFDTFLTLRAGRPGNPPFEAFWGFRAQRASGVLYMAAPIARQTRKKYSQNSSGEQAEANFAIWAFKVLHFSGKEKAHKHKQFFPVTARAGGVSRPGGGGGLPTGGQGSKVYVLCAEPKEHKRFRPGTRPGGIGFLAGRIGDRGDREIVYVPNVYVPFLAPNFGLRSSCEICAS